MLKHSVIFNLKPHLSFKEFSDFLEAVNSLSKIEGVENFEVLKQINPKTSFMYGISMEFKSQSEYDFYCNHSLHVNFIENFWSTNVLNFLEIDFKPIR